MCVCGGGGGGGGGTHYDLTHYDRAESRKTLQTKEKGGKKTHKITEKEIGQDNALVSAHLTRAMNFL